jgi:hypothetical protein
MKKILFVIALAFMATASITAQNHPRSKKELEKATPEQKAKILEMREKVKKMTRAERKAFFEQNGGRPKDRAQDKTKN